MPSWLANSMAIGLGGAAGALGRYWIGVIVNRYLGVAFPYATLVVNASGSLALGFLSGFWMHSDTVPQWLKLGVGVGVLGAFTTFSTFSVETLHFIEQGHTMRAIANVLANVLICLAFAALGLWLARGFGSTG